MWGTASGGIRLLGYTLRPIEENQRPRRYTAEELRRMTLFQLRDICETETIIAPRLYEYDKHDLEDLILQFRGSRETHLITEYMKEGKTRLEDAMKKVAFRLIPHNIGFSAKLTAYQGLDTNFFDGYSISYLEDMDGVNAVVLDQKNSICGFFNIQSFPGKEDLFLTRDGKIPCSEAEITDYRLWIFPRELSQAVFEVYMGGRETLPPETMIYSLPLLDFVVLEPSTVHMPLTIDFGTTNTVTGLFVDQEFYHTMKESGRYSKIKQEEINYVNFLSLTGEVTPIVPTAIGVDSIKDGKPVFNIGYDAQKMIVDGYLGEGFCIFMDIKRWVGDYEKEEELSDAYGNRLLMKRSEIIKAFLDYIIDNARQRFKCNFESVFLCYPVKQRERFLSLFLEILPEYHIPEDDLIDESTAVIMNTIGDFIDHDRYRNGVPTKALVVDCGGGTTDLTSCTFTVENQRISYKIDIETAYENGDTDFGGNNLTFRILQLLKIEAAYRLTGHGSSIAQLLNTMEMDTYRAVDEYGKDAIYKDLEQAYAEAEHIIPTRFKEYEYSTRDEYFMVRNNYYFLFTLAEEVKKIFFENTSTLRLLIGSELAPASDVLKAKRWKMAVRQNNQLRIIKEFPTVEIGIVMINTVLAPDIYDIIRRFFSPLYSSGELSEFKAINMTGQSTKIGLFRDSLKEFIPGRLIRGKKEDKAEDYRLKLTCIEGAIRYIRDKRQGKAKIEITSKEPSLPYVLSSTTHTGEVITLIHPLDRDKNYGAVSRAIQSVELRLVLSDTKNRQIYTYNVYCSPDEFESKTYEEIRELYGERVPQAEVDIIENGEVRYFVWVDKGNWGFNVVPISRLDETLHIGKLQLFAFESESWLLDMFDGTN